MVALELLLKDVLNLVQSPENAGHDLPTLLTMLKQKDKRLVAPLNSLQTQLRERLTVIRCQGRAGTALSIPAASYPHVRYIRHESDWPSDYSTDAQLHAVCSTIEKLSAKVASWSN